MTRSRPTESLVSALVILLIALVLLLARATAHGCSAVPPALIAVTTADSDPTGGPQTCLPGRAGP
jgi:hypothetical protein